MKYTLALLLALLSLLLVTSPAVAQFDDEDDADVAAAKDKQDDLEDVQKRTEELDYQLGKLRRNADSYDRETYERKLKHLQWDAEDLASDSDDIGADKASGNFEDAAGRLRKTRRAIDIEPSTFYRERNDELDRDLKKSIWSTEDASKELEDFSSELQDATGDE